MTPAEIPFSTCPAVFSRPRCGAGARARFTAEEDRATRAGGRHQRPSVEAAVRSRSVDRALARNHSRGEPYIVAGVMPPGFSFMDKSVDVWVPIGFSRPGADAARALAHGRRATSARRHHRRRRNATWRRVHAELTRLFPAFNTGWTARVVPLGEQLTGDIRPALLGDARQRSGSCCSSRAPTLPTCCWRGRRRVSASSPSVPPGRGRGGDWSGSSWRRAPLLAAAGGLAGLAPGLVGRRTCFASIVAESLPIQRLESVRLDGLVLALHRSLLSLISGLVARPGPGVDGIGRRLDGHTQRQAGRGGSARAGARQRVRRRGSAPPLCAARRRRPPRAQLRRADARRPRLQRRPHGHRCQVSLPDTQYSDDARVRSSSGSSSGCRRPPRCRGIRRNELPAAQRPCRRDVVRSGRPAGAGARRGTCHRRPRRDEPTTSPRWASRSFAAGCSTNTRRLTAPTTSIINEAMATQVLAGTGSCRQAHQGQLEQPS